MLIGPTKSEVIAFAITDWKGSGKFSEKVSEVAC